MKWNSLLAGVWVALISAPYPLLAQVRDLTPEERAAQDAAAAAGCAACGGGFVIVIVAAIALSIALLVWVARDAKSRGMDSAALWMLLVFFTNFIGLIIYICARPQGTLKPCPHCKNKRLTISATCPHCGHA